MKPTFIMLALTTLIFSGCHRPDTLTRTYHVPALDTPQKAKALHAALNAAIPNEISEVKVDLQARTLTATFNEQKCRTMNLEQLIAESGFAVNERPAYHTQ
jgi:hypothetical protein